MRQSRIRNSLRLWMVSFACLLWIGWTAPGQAGAGVAPIGSTQAAQAARLALMAQSQGPGGISAGSPGWTIRILSVGVVLTADGTIWQYVPDQGRWYNIDESFRLMKKESHILPLPVPLEAIQDMQTYGFLLTTRGECWLYDMGSNHWGKIPSPPSRP